MTTAAATSCAYTTDASALCTTRRTVGGYKSLLPTQYAEPVGHRHRRRVPVKLVIIRWHWKGQWSGSPITRYPTDVDPCAAATRRGLVRCESVSYARIQIGSKRTQTDQHWSPAAESATPTNQPTDDVDGRAAVRGVLSSQFSTGRVRTRDESVYWPHWVHWPLTTDHHRMQHIAARLIRRNNY